MNHREVPLMFQAQTEGRCQLQRPSQPHPAYEWKDEWTKPYPKPAKRDRIQTKTPPKPWERPPKQTASSSGDPVLGKAPKFGRGVQTKNYKLNWRLVTNSGQDDSIIRPVIGTKGYPHFPGSSMKGAFQRACNTEAQVLDYCGGEITENGEVKTKPGILRFHGGYPVDTSWVGRLVDPVHSQQDKQVIKDEKTNANVQISLYRVELCFGISSSDLEPDDPQWQQIWSIWEKALSQGLGSRVSAGYGRFAKASEPALLEVQLTGRGPAAMLLAKETSQEKTKTPEFRPNTFKATLRGHTLRLFGGLTDPATAKYLTSLLWGGFRDKNYRGKRADFDAGQDALFGLLGIDFEGDLESAIDFHEYSESSKGRNPNRSQKSPQLMPIYDIENAKLRVLSIHPNSPPDRDRQLTELAMAIVQFAMLFGGFGKSWRRIDHLKFYKRYTDRKPTIGCHWEFASGSEPFYVSVDTLADVARCIDRVRGTLKNWGSQFVDLGGSVASSWREAWYPHCSNGGVQVWGRISENTKSEAIGWFHNRGTHLIYDSYLTGGLKKDQPSQTGRIWHRMYPHYKRDRAGKLQPTGGYVELLVLFPGYLKPDGSDKGSQFLKFLDEETHFTQIW